MLTELTLDDCESKGIPKLLLAGRPFNPLDWLPKVPIEFPIVRGNLMA